MTGRGVGYVRTSTSKQELSPAAQLHGIQVLAEQVGIELESVVSEVASARHGAPRPVLAEVLSSLDRHDYGVLLVAKIDRLTRSPSDMEAIVRRSLAKKWEFRAADFYVDPKTATGALVLQLLATFAKFEVDQLRERTSAALAARKDAGATLGRPVHHDPVSIARLLELRASGFTYDQISATLTNEPFLTPGGHSEWHPTQVARLLRLYQPLANANDLVWDQSAPIRTLKHFNSRNPEKRADDLTIETEM